MNDLYQLVYISRISSSALGKVSALRDIMHTSKHNNQQHQITGVLCFGNGCFFQCIEGERAQLTQLRANLLADTRHHDMQVLDFSVIEVRQFSHWTMRLLVLERWLLSDAEIKQLTPFKPYSWAAGRWQSFLQLLVAYYRQKDSAKSKYSSSEADTARDYNDSVYADWQRVDNNSGINSPLAAARLQNPDSTLRSASDDVNGTVYNAFGSAVTKLVGEHQAFIAVQSILALLILISLVCYFMVGF